MKLILIIAIAILLTSCNNSPLVSQLEGSDSVAVRFTAPGSGALIKVVGTSQPYAIKDLLRFAGGDETEQFKCGYDGHVLFYKQGTLAGDVAFNYTGDGCRHFLIEANGKLTATRMSNEAIDFLKALANSNNYGQ
jgi:hypothetical protein